MSYLITRIEKNKNYKNKGYGVCLLVESGQESINLKWFATGQSQNRHVANVVLKLKRIHWNWKHRKWLKESQRCMYRATDSKSAYIQELKWIYTLDTPQQMHFLWPWYSSSTLALFDLNFSQPWHQWRCQQIQKIVIQMNGKYSSL